MDLCRRSFRPSPPTPCFLDGQPLVDCRGKAPLPLRAVVVGSMFSSSAAAFPCAAPEKAPDRVPNLIMIMDSTGKYLVEKLRKSVSLVPLFP